MSGRETRSYFTNGGKVCGKMTTVLCCVKSDLCGYEALNCIILVYLIQIAKDAKMI